MRKSKQIHNNEVSEPNIRIEDHPESLAEKAEELSVPNENTDDFVDDVDDVMDYLLKKNAELYQRLA